MATSNNPLARNSSHGEGLFFLYFPFKCVRNMKNLTEYLGVLLPCHLNLQLFANTYSDFLKNSNTLLEEMK